MLRLFRSTFSVVILSRANSWQKAKITLGCNANALVSSRGSSGADAAQWRILSLIHINILGLLTNSSRPLIFGLNRSWKMKHQSWLVQWFETFNIFWLQFLKYYKTAQKFCFKEINVWKWQEVDEQTKVWTNSKPFRSCCCFCGSDQRKAELSNNTTNRWFRFLRAAIVDLHRRFAVSEIWPSPQEPIVTVGFPALSAVMSWFCKLLRYCWNPFHSEKQQPIFNLRHEGPKKLNDFKRFFKFSCKKHQTLHYIVSAAARKPLLYTPVGPAQVSHLNLRLLRAPVWEF